MLKSKNRKKNRILRRIARTFLITIIALVVIKIIFNQIIRIDPPDVELKMLEERVELDSNFYAIGNNRLKKAEVGLWELYLEGKPFDRGLIAGKLTHELIIMQEAAFIEHIKEMIPSDFFLYFLKSFIQFFNRNIDENIPEEYLLEIYGISQFTTHKFDYIGDCYDRILNYHAAHDIGHALQNMNMVACSSFAVWDSHSGDSSLLVGRNFDFYVGDEFAKDKIVAFYHPDSGHDFMMITWGGMIGAVSGMNDQGLTVSLNAAKSKPPLAAKTPVSILSRKILQYASSIEQAYQIAQEFDTFVSESILVASATDGYAAIIEKRPDSMALYRTFSNHIVCTNHFQSEKFQHSTLTKQNIKQSASKYRHNRIQELLDSFPQTTTEQAAQILRDRKGYDGKNIGLGNEKAINQLIAHHSVIFKPEQLKVWVSTAPYQLGDYVAYDLKKVFQTFPEMKQKDVLYQKELTIPADTFLTTTAFDNFQQYRSLQKSIDEQLSNKQFDDISSTDIEQLIALNPNYFEPYFIAGKYYQAIERPKKAIEFFKKALKCEIPTLSQQEKIKENISFCH